MFDGIPAKVSEDNGKQSWVGLYAQVGRKRDLGFDPALGSTFDIVTADAITNSASIIGTTPSGRFFSSSIVNGGDGREILRLVVVPEPGLFSMASVAGVALMSSRRRRGNR